MQEARKAVRHLLTIELLETLDAEKLRKLNVSYPNGNKDLAYEMLAMALLQILKHQPEDKPGIEIARRMPFLPNGG